MDFAFKYVKDNGGIDTEASYNYTAKTGKTCLYNATNSGANLTSWVDIPHNSEAVRSHNETLKTAILSVFRTFKKQLEPLGQSPWLLTPAAQPSTSTRRECITTRGALARDWTTASWLLDMGLLLLLQDQIRNQRY